VVFARERPDPVPGIFGYHYEIFHALVLAGTAELGRPEPLPQQEGRR
jgi:hypothetical protein